MRATLLAMTFAVALAGCVSDEDRAEEQRLRNEAYTAMLNNTCLGYGYQPGKPEWSACLMQLDQSERQARANMLNMAILGYMAGGGGSSPTTNYGYQIPNSPVNPAITCGQVASPYLGANFGCW